jgi:HK97 family phage major capsid protein
MNAYQKRMSELFKEFENIRKKAENEARKMTTKEITERESLKAQIEETSKAAEKAEQDALAEIELRTTLYGDGGNNALTLESGVTGGAVDREQRGGRLLAPSDKKDYRSLFGAQREHSWTDKETSFFQAIFSGRHHPGLIRTAMTEGVPSDGGFLVPVEYSSQIHNVSLENELVMPRCFVQPMLTNEIKLPAMEIGDHSSNLFGGFTASYVAETGDISEANPKTRMMTLSAKKLTGLLRFSNELAQDIPGGEQQIVNICGKGLSYYRDRAFLKGSGVGEPLGILNADCVVSVDKKTGQKADTIQYGNLTQMMSRMYAGSFANSVWVCHQTCIPQLLELSIAVGVGGSVIPVMSESNGEFKILTRPVLFTEKTEPLGDVGDIMLVDFSQYVIGLRTGMRFDMSPHIHFKTDELMARLIERHDGQPLWDEALTLEDGSTTVSPFITLAERA